MSTVNWLKELRKVHPIGINEEPRGAIVFFLGGTNFFWVRLRCHSKLPNLLIQKDDSILF